MTVGLDLGDRRHHACVFDEANEFVADEATTDTREVLIASATRYSGATCQSGLGFSGV